MNINHKIIQLGVGLWEQRMTEGISKEEMKDRFEESLKEMSETRQLTMDLTPHQKAVLLFMTTTIIAILASCMEDKDSAAPVVAATIVKSVDKLLREDFDSGRLKMPMNFADIIGMTLMFPKPNRE